MDKFAAANPGYAAKATARYRKKHPDRIANYSTEYRQREDVKARHAAAQREYRKKHPDKAAASVKASYAKNPSIRAGKWRRRRYRLAGAVGSYTEAEWQQIVVQQRGRCIDCGLKRKLERDHIIPIAKGGCNYAFNIAGRCRQCNAAKADKLIQSQASLFDHLCC